MIYINGRRSNGTGDIQWRARGFNVSQTTRTFLSSRARYISVRLRSPICLLLAHYAITFPSSVTASSPSLIFSLSLAAQLGCVGGGGSITGCHGDAATHARCTRYRDSCGAPARACLRCVPTVPASPPVRASAGDAAAPPARAAVTAVWSGSSHLTHPASSGGSRTIMTEHQRRGMTKKDTERCQARFASAQLKKLARASIIKPGKCSLGLTELRFSGSPVLRFSCLNTPVGRLARAGTGSSSEVINLFPAPSVQFCWFCIFLPPSCWPLSLLVSLPFCALLQISHLYVPLLFHVLLS